MSRLDTSVDGHLHPGAFNKTKGSSLVDSGISNTRRPLASALKLAAGIVVAALALGCAHSNGEFVPCADGEGGLGGADLGNNTNEGGMTTTTSSSTTSTFIFAEDSDEDCGILDEERPCHPNPAWKYSDDPQYSTSACHPGFQVCLSTYKWSECLGATKATFEKCSSILDADNAPDSDENCDGVVNENCICKVGEEVPCYDYGDDKAGVGICTMGTKTCFDGQLWNSCLNQVPPKQEEECTLYDPDTGLPIGPILDDDCDGIPDKGCCIPNSYKDCYAGPAGTEGIGECKSGFEFCNNNGKGYGSCYAEVDPKPEKCDGLDNDCNGLVDDNCSN